MLNSYWEMQLLFSLLAPDGSTLAGLCHRWPLNYCRYESLRHTALVGWLLRNKQQGRARIYYAYAIQHDFLAHKTSYVTQTTQDLRTHREELSAQKLIEKIVYRLQDACYEFAARTPVTIYAHADESLRRLLEARGGDFGGRECGRHE